MPDDDRIFHCAMKRAFENSGTKYIMKPVVDLAEMSQTIDPEVKNGKKVLIIVDDLRHLTWCNYIEELFTRRSRHEKIGVFLLLQCILKNKSGGTFALQKDIQDICLETVNYLCIFDVNSKSTIGKLSDDLFPCMEKTYLLFI